MNRGRATARGGRRGAASADTPRAPAPDAGEAAADEPPNAGAPSTAPRRGSTSRATRAPSVGRFRPKAVRRDEADRELLARQEEQKAHERAAEERRARGRSRFRSKRSRGDAMGSRGGWGRGITTASGPFSGGFAGSSGRAGGWYGGGGGGGAGVGVPGGTFKGAGGRHPKTDSKGFSQADDLRMRETRINADKLHPMTPEEELDSDDEAMMAALSNRAPSVLPMGIYRREHKETEVVVATTAELEAAENATGEEESLWVDGDEGAPPALQPEEQGVWSSRADKQFPIKKEPGLEDAMDLDAGIKHPPDGEKKPAPAKMPKKEVPQDPEDKTIQADLELLASELGAVTVTEDGETKGPANKDGRLYLFQFPPLISPLKQVAAPQPRSNVKEEPKALSVLDVPAMTSDATPVDLTQDDASRQATADGGGGGGGGGGGDDDDTGGFRSQPLSQGGMVGRLNVRRSGKVELDWGGVTLELSPAAGMNFLTTAVIVEENDEKPQHGVAGGEGIAMGKIMGRFVLAPVWSDEEDWNVAPPQLTVG